MTLYVYMTAFFKENWVLYSQTNSTYFFRESKNLLEAASLGASRAVALVANVAANIIAFLALLAFSDAVLSWLGGMFDYPQLSFSVNTHKHTHNPQT